MSELRECPFCGKNADLGIGRGTEDREGFPTYIYCSACGCNGPWFYTRDKGCWTSTFLCSEKSGWNTRAYDQQLTALRAEMDSMWEVVEAAMNIHHFGGSDNPEDVSIFVTAVTKYKEARG